MSTITTGRTLDPDGEPIPGTGLRIDEGGPIAGKLADRAGPLLSNPTTGEWVTTLVPAESTGGEYATGLGVFPADGDSPPAHYHVGYEESFEVLQGEFRFDVDGETERLSPGDELTVPPETPHGFQNVGDGPGATLTTTRPAARTRDVIATLYGLAHEGKLGDDGQPGFLQGMAMTAEMADDTVFTSPPPAVAKPLAKALAPVAGALGYQPVYQKYATDEFWERTVEQPSL